MAGEVSLTIEQIAAAVREGVAQAASSTSVTDIVSAGSALALVLLTGVLARYTWILAKEAQKARESQTQPNVIVTAVHDANRPTIIQLVIRNIGHGLAENVTFKASRPLFVAYGLGEETNAEAKPILRGPFTTGIPALGPGESRIINWGQPGGLLKMLGSSTIAITCKYEFEGLAMPPNVCHVDIESFMGTVSNDSIELRAVNALESIAKKTT